MGTAGVHEGVRWMRFESLVGRWERGELGQSEAAEMLGGRVWGGTAHRKSGPGRRLGGMLLHQEGSRHAWLEGQPPLDLIVTMDDASSEVLSLLLVAEEGTASTLRGLREVVGEHGLFL